MSLNPASFKRTTNIMEPNVNLVRPILFITLITVLSMQRRETTEGTTCFCKGHLVIPNYALFKPIVLVYLDFCSLLKLQGNY
jgi:hypothetical protein